jgi:succinate-semialdehyde dehydrogenase / glutarate-semialdehyde dehydrogenase
VTTFTTSPSEESTSLVHVERTGLLIGGRWRPAASGATFPVDDPATGAVIAEVADAEDAVAAAAAVAASWAAPPRERSEILRRTWDGRGQPWAGVGPGGAFRRGDAERTGT